MQKSYISDNLFPPAVGGELVLFAFDSWHKTLID